VFNNGRSVQLTDVGSVDNKYKMLVLSEEQLVGWSSVLFISNVDIESLVRRDTSTQ